MAASVLRNLCSSGTPRARSVATERVAISTHLGVDAFGKSSGWSQIALIPMKLFGRELRQHRLRYSPQIARRGIS